MATDIYSIFPESAYYRLRQQQTNKTMAEQWAESLRAMQGSSPWGQLQGAYGQAREANERRYAEILAGYRQRYAEGMGLLRGQGEQEEADIRSGWAGQASGMQQDLTSRGLAGTTVLPTMRAGYQRGMEADLRRAREGRIGRQLAYQTGLSGDTLQFMERRTDQYPDLMGYYGMLQGYGQYGNQPRYPSVNSIYGRLYVQ